nr:type IV secretory system conjugative DNA transfer family protein [uncultured Bacteroides sp.]
MGKRKLMTPDEVLRLPLDQALIILRGQKVLKVGKYDYTLHPESRKLKESRASDHIPAWRQLPETEEPDFFNLMKPKPKPKKPKAPKKPLASAVRENPFADVPDDPPTLFPSEEEYTIIVTDKKSIMT